MSDNDRNQDRKLKNFGRNHPKISVNLASSRKIDFSVGPRVEKLTFGVCSALVSTCRASNGFFLAISQIDTMSQTSGDYLLSGKKKLLFNLAMNWILFRQAHKWQWAIGVGQGPLLFEDPAKRSSPRTFLYIYIYYKDGQIVNRS